MYVSLKQAENATGVPYLTIARMIERGSVRGKRSGCSKRSSLVYEDDLELIRSIYCDHPAAGDPTPEEIAQRCEIVRATREAERKSESREFEQLCQRAVRVLATGPVGITGLVSALGLSNNVAAEVVAKLVADGRVVTTGRCNGTRYHATEGDSADAILTRFNRKARRHVRRRHRRAQPQLAAA